MTAPVIIDAIVVVILVIFTCLGARRGLLQSLAGLVIVIVALVGAAMVAETFSGAAAKLAAPLIEKQISQRVAEAIANQGELAIDWENDAGHTNLIPNLLERLGVDEDTREDMTEQIRNALKAAGKNVSDAMVTTIVVESLTRTMIYGILFGLSFVLLLLLMRVLLTAMSLVTKLPGVHGLNALGGGVLGLIEGVILLFLLVWIAKQLGVNVHTSELEDAHILQIFTDNTPFGLLSYLQKA